MSSNGRNQNETSVRGRYYNNGDDGSFQNITGFNAVKVNAAKGSQLLITLTVPDTWCDKAGDGAWFGIKVGGKVIARGLYSVASDGQRIPVTLQTVLDVDNDKVIEIQPVWCNTNGAQGACHIGSYSESVLTVLMDALSIDPNILKKMINDILGMPK